MRPLSLLLLFTAVSCASNPRSEAPSPGVVPIAQARRLSQSAEVAVEGVVTVPSGVIDAGFAIQDASGGIYVAADSTVRYAVGERLRIHGSLGDNHGLTTIRPTRVERTGPGGGRTAPAPRRVATGAVGESTEGWLVEVEGRVTGPVVDDRPYGWKVYVDDGSGLLLVFLSINAGIDAAALREGLRLRAVGLSGQYDQHHEVLPRSPADLTIEG